MLSEAVIQRSFQFDTVDDLDEEEFVSRVTLSEKVWVKSKAFKIAYKVDFRMSGLNNILVVCEDILRCEVGDLFQAYGRKDGAESEGRRHEHCEDAHDGEFEKFDGLRSEQKRNLGQYPVGLGHGW